MGHKGIQVFISYRRDGGRDIARNIYERLSLSGYNTFFDYNSIRNGIFNEQIYTAIEQAHDFIFILSPKALDRCHEENDWVRLELEYAISLDKNIIILSSEEAINFPQDMPESLSKLRYIQAIFLNQNYYDQSIERLINALSPITRPVMATILRIVSAVMACVILFLAFWGIKKFFRASQDSENYHASVYLMRTNDLKSRYGVDYSLDSIGYYYADSISNDLGNLYVYPESELLLFPSEDFRKVKVPDSIPHVKNYNPILQLKLHSTDCNTLIINRVEIEVEDFQFFDIPYFILHENSSGLNVSGYGKASCGHARLDYACLSDMEHFAGYDSHIDMTIENHSSAIYMDSHHSEGTHTIVGRLTHNDMKYMFMIDDTRVSYHDDKSLIDGIKTFELHQGKSQVFQYPNILISLAEEEVEDNLAFQLKARASCKYRIRIKLSTPSGQEIYTNWIYMNHFVPEN